MCSDCYDYEAAVLFNAYAGDLWRRFTTYLPRHLAALAGVTQKALRTVVRIRYVKVAEYQARGVVHFHAVIRLDAPGSDYQPPPPRYTAVLLCDAIRQATAAVTLTVSPGPAGPAVRLTFGAPQGTDARPTGSCASGAASTTPGWPTWKRSRPHDRYLRRANLGHPRPQGPPKAISGALEGRNGRVRQVVQHRGPRGQLPIRARPGHSSR
jgi:hypothetical protein